MSVPRSIILLGFVGALVACGAPPSDEPTNSAPPAGTEATIPDSVPLVVLQKEGGIAGATSELTLFRNGDATLAQEPAPGGIPVRRWTVATADYDGIAALLRSPEIAALESEYLPENTCCDRITYTITVPAATDRRTIRTMDAAQHPDALADLLDRLSALEITAPQ